MNGTVIAQLIAILSMPILARIYSTSDFGYLSEVVVIATLVSMFGTLSYESSIVIEGDDKNAKNIFAMCVLISLIVCTVAFIALLVILGLENWIKSLYIFISSQLVIFMNILHSFYNRLALYKKISYSTIIRLTSIVFVQILFGYFFWTSDMLIIGTLFGSLVSILFLIHFLCLKDIFSDVSRKAMKSMALKHIDFVKYSTPQNIIGYVFGSNFPLFAIMFYYDASILGMYYLAKKILHVPGVVLVSAVKRVFYKESSVLVQSNDFIKLYKIYIKMIKYLTLIIMLPVFILFYYSIDIFVFVLGEDWRMAGEFARWMALSYGSLFLSSPVRSLFLVFNKQKNLLVVEIITGVTSSLLFLFSNYFYSLIDAIAYFSVSLFVSNIAVIVYWNLYLNNKKNAIYS